MTSVRQPLISMLSRIRWSCVMIVMIMMKMMLSWSGVDHNDHGRDDVVAGQDGDGVLEHPGEGAGEKEIWSWKEVVGWRWWWQLLFW